MFKNKQDNMQHKHLVKTGLFWAALLGPISVAAILGAVIAWSTDLGGVCGTSRCVQNFFGHFKIPLTIAGLALPFVAMAAAIHRSMEAALQIDLANKQYGEALKNNRFGNYLKHRESFEKLIDNYCSRNYYNSVSRTKVASDALYAKIFPFSGYSNSGWSGEYDSAYVRKMEGYARAAIAEAAKDESEFNRDVFFKSLKYLLGGIGIDYMPMLGITVKLSDGGILKFGVVGLENDITAISSSLRDAVFVLRLFKSFLGEHDMEGLKVNSVYEDVKVKMKLVSESFASKKYEFV